MASAGSNFRQPSAYRDEVARRVAEEMEALAIEAGVEPRDPPAPGGNLSHDIATFTTLEACVRAHRITDPVLADAIDGLGYDTLVRDGCRTLQALKSKDGKLCLPIAASLLRQRCEAQVAIFVGEPSLCPLVAGAGAAPAREPVCLARASRDERLCAAALPADRAPCKALVQGRSGECGGNETCIRQVERYRSLLEKPASHAPFPTRLHVEFVGERAQTEKYDGAFDIEELAAAGAVARSIGDKVRLTIGTPRNALWPSWDSPGATPHLFLSLTVPTQMPSAGARDTDAAAGWVLGPLDLSLDLLIPHVALLAGSLASERHVRFESLSAAAGSPVRLTLTTKVSEGGRTFRIKVELETFVRDGMDPRLGTKGR